MAGGKPYTDLEDRLIQAAVERGARLEGEFAELALSLGRPKATLRRRAIAKGWLEPDARRAPGPPPAVAYSDADDAQLLALKARGLTETEIAAQTGRSRWNVRRRLSWLDGRAVARAAMRAPVREADAVSAAQAKACERHAAACLAAGGFWALSERRVGLGKLGACLPLIPPPQLQEARQ